MSGFHLVTPAGYCDSQLAMQLAVVQLAAQYERSLQSKLASQAVLYVLQEPTFAFDRHEVQVPEPLPPLQVPLEQD